ncbi:Gfo/Idh/MocA family protein [Larkinella terrae]|uniref:Gfo/Idh/MocA family oxidoreductase n=1 Tax=Larkinella terrae TaxID=2025311 RepID=A0A7K0EUU1_9BACT|nr:Gfo/Idh/MocA family oxidoreductase [Larkinella terrae]MRS65281.1 gfo/Idh/MocA family oxidoreductase [Larkinella terrae]
MIELQQLKRRTFLKTTIAGSVPFVFSKSLKPVSLAQPGKRIGIIGLDTSHSVAFTKALHAAAESDTYKGYKVVAAYPYGSQKIQSSKERIPGYMEQIGKYQVAIVDSIRELLTQVDFVLLETNDGTLHLPQALEVLAAGKPLFIDKPMAASLRDAIAIFKAAEKYKVPVFSTSSLRYIKGMDELKKEKVIGADTFSSATIEPSHPDLFWYGIHGIEPLMAAMGPGCRQVSRISRPDCDLVIGLWADNRIGTFRGLRDTKVGYGGTVFTQAGERVLGPFGGYEPLLAQIINFFETGKVPVTQQETIDVLALMEAADESKKQHGAFVSLESMIARARQ